MFQSLGDRRSAVGGVPGERARAALSFFADIDRAIAKAGAGGAFDRFVLAAPPRVLAAIRSGLSDDLQTRVVCELAKDLTKVPDAELHERLDRLSLLER